MIGAEPLQIGELCRRIGVPYPNAKYILERGFLPEGAEANPGHGHYRKLTIGQATWLAIVLLLKVMGVRVPQAALVANFAREAVRKMVQEGGLDPDFAPFEGRLVTDRHLYVDFGDMRYIRLSTDIGPNMELYPRVGWYMLEEPFCPVPLARPMACLRLDLTQITQSLVADPTVVNPTVADRPQSPVKLILRPEI
jgi:hypothetical protein